MARSASDDDPLHRLPGLHRDAPAAAHPRAASRERASSAWCRRSSWAWRGRRVEALEREHPHARGRLEPRGGRHHRAGPRHRGRRAARELRRSLKEAYHLAAVYDLAVSREVGRRINVEGTRNVLRVPAEAPRLRRACTTSPPPTSRARRAGVFRETDLDVGQGFKNHYEETKFLAEVEVGEERRCPPRSTGPASWWATRGPARPRSSTGPTSSCAAMERLPSPRRLPAPRLAAPAR